MRGDPGSLSPGILVAVAAAGLVAGCATAPVRPAAEWLGVLPTGATMYLALDVQKAADPIASALGEQGPAARDVLSLVRSTRRAWASVAASPSGTSSFTMVGLGSYPACLIGCRLGGSRDWKRVTTPRGAWYQWQKAGVELSVPTGFVALVAGGPMGQSDIEGLLARYQKPAAAAVPPEVAADMDAADFVLYLPQLPGGLAAPGGMALPVRELWIDGRRTDARWDVTGTANATSEQGARGLALVARLALVSWLRGQGIPDVSARLRTVTLEADGSQVKLAGLAFADSEIVRVLGSLLLGGRAPGTALEGPPQ